MTEPSVSTFSLEGAVRLDHMGLIGARGADAAAFLHGQLTHDFSGLGLGEARLAALCSAKGRMLASFVVYTGAVIWVFAVRSARRAWAGLLVAALVLLPGAAWVWQGGAAA